MDRTGVLSLALVVVLAAVGTGVGSVAAGEVGTGDGRSVVEASDPAVRIVAVYPTGGEYEREKMLDDSDFASVGSVKPSRGDGYYVPVTLTEATARNFSRRLQELGFTGQGMENCRWEATPDDPGYCLLTVHEGDVVFSAGLAPGLANQMNEGQFVEDPTFRLIFENRSRAREVRAAITGETVTTTTAIEGVPTPGFTLPAALAALLAVVAGWNLRRRR